MPLSEDHFEPVIAKEETTKSSAASETSSVAGGKAPSGYLNTFAKEVPNAAQKAASVVGNAIVNAANPIHKTDEGEVDYGATGLHTAADLAALELAKAGIKRAVAPNPLAAQNTTMLTIAKMEAKTAAEQRAHELELAKIKASGNTQAKPVTSVTTPTLAQINSANTSASTTPNSAAPITTDVAPPSGTQLNPVDPNTKLSPSTETPSFTPENPPVDLTTEVGKEPKEGPMVKQGTANTQKNAVAENKKAVAAQKQTFKTPVELPEGTVFKEGWGGADSWLNDQVGKEKAKAIRNTYNQGRGFGSGAEAVKNAATAMADFGNTQFMTQGEPTILSKDNRQRFGIAPPPQSGALNKVFPKAVKVGGLAGLLLTANEAANAKTLKGAAGTVGEAFLPIGVTPTGTNANEAEELARRRYAFEQQSQKLGSPFRSVPPPR